MIRGLLIAVFCSFLVGAGQSQHFVLADEDTLATFPVSDTIQVRQFASQWVLSQIDHGFVQARKQATSLSSDSVAITSLSRGKQFSFSEVAFVESSGDTVGWNQRISRKVEALANNGYPFAELQLVAVDEMAEDELSVLYQIDYGPEIYFDSIVTAGDLPLKSSVFYRLLDIYPGQRYSEQRYLLLESRMADLEFVELKGPPDIGFFADKAQIFLQLEALDKNKFDAMLGLVPNAGQGSSVNGFADLHLANLFRSAISLDASWKAFGALSQSVAFASRIPALGRTNVGVDMEGSILRQDSSFVRSDIGSRVVIKPKARLNVLFGYRREASTKLGGSDQLINGFTYDWYNAAICLSCASLSSFSRISGRALTIDGSLGVRTLSETQGGQSASSVTWSLEGTFLWKRSFGNRSLFQTEERMALLRNQEGLIFNEQIRLGGLNSMRGFFENQFFVSEYYLSRNEVRLYLEEQSYLLAFIDGGMIDTTQQRFYGSAGIGLSLSTNAGILNLIFAQGRMLDGSDTINNVIHFGYSAVF